MKGRVVVGGPSVEERADVRLGRGDFVSVHMGPLPVGDRVWYLVWPAEDATIGYSTVSWNTAAADGGASPGWVAAVDGSTQNLGLHRRPDAAEILGWGPSLVASGTSDYESPPQACHDYFSLNWAVAPGDDGPVCAFSMTLVPSEGPEPVIAVDISTTNVAQGPLTGEGSLVGTSWNPSEGGDWDAYTVSVASDCAWAFSLSALGHD